MKRLSIKQWLLLIEGVGYSLIFLPFLTDFLETGHWPRAPHHFITEIIIGILILFYVRVISRVRRLLIKMEKEREEMTMLLLHDMKTPLSVVMCTLSNLENYPDHPERNKWIKAALRSCREDVELMTELVETDRLEGKKFSVEKRIVDVPELMRSCAQEMSAMAAHKGVTLNVTHGADLKTVFADEGLLRRVVLNLMRNALKSTKAGGRLDVRAETRNEWLVVKVRDTGIGIPPENMDRLFSRFSRVQADGNSQEGWGLGLYFCKLAVESHGGRIDISSRPGKGTLVRFAIPMNEQSLNKDTIGSIQDDFEEIAEKPKFPVS